jgi:hypothetical protein
MSRQTDIVADLASRSGMNDSEAANALSALTVAAVVDVPTRTIRRYLALNGKLGGIEIGARGTDAFAATCQTVLRVLEPGAFDDLDFDDAEVIAKIGAMCDVLIAGGALLSGDKTTILSMGNASVPKYNPPVHHSEVAAARGRP